MHGILTCSMPTAFFSFEGTCTPTSTILKISARGTTILVNGKWGIFFFYRIIYTVSAKNGGYVEVEDRDDYPTDVSVDKYYYNGQTVTRSFTFQWDMQSPYHCSETEDTGTSSCPYPQNAIIYMAEVRF
jgi:hypothetical protein